MTGFERSDLIRRLDGLALDLERFPPGLDCPWPLARVFNELLKQVKRDLSEDAIIRGMRLVEESPPEIESDTDTQAGTLRGLITQVRIALEAAQPPKEKSAPVRRTESPSGSRSSGRASRERKSKTAKK